MQSCVYGVYGARQCRVVCVEAVVACDCTNLGVFPHATLDKDPHGDLFVSMVVVKMHHTASGGSATLQMQQLAAPYASHTVQEKLRIGDMVWWFIF